MEAHFFGFEVLEDSDIDEETLGGWVEQVFRVGWGQEDWEHGSDVRVVVDVDIFHTQLDSLSQVSGKHSDFDALDACVDHL